MGAMRFLQWCLLLLILCIVVALLEIHLEFRAQVSATLDTVRAKAEQLLNAEDQVKVTWQHNVSPPDGPIQTIEATGSTPAQFQANYNFLMQQFPPNVPGG